MILVDTNVLLDVIQKREPFYRTSAAVLDHVIRLRCRGFLPTHAVTTIHYLVDRYQDAKTANQAVAWLLSHFDIAGITRAELVTAQSYGWKDYEDAVVAAAAKTQGCRHIVTRNVRDFGDSPVPAVTPEEYLSRILQTEERR
jgi:predicted nucleic acid-binding protein